MPAKRQVWLVSSGPPIEGEPVELINGCRFPHTWQPIADRIQPCDIALLHGNVDIKKLIPIETWVPINVRSPGGDYRIWDEITDWTGEIASRRGCAVWRRQPARVGRIVTVVSKLDSEIWVLIFDDPIKPDGGGWVIVT